MNLGHLGVAAFAVTVAVSGPARACDSDMVSIVEPDAATLARLAAALDVGEAFVAEEDRLVSRTTCDLNGDGRNEALYQVISPMTCEDGAVLTCTMAIFAEPDGPLLARALAHRLHAVPVTDGAWPPVIAHRRRAEGPANETILQFDGCAYRGPGEPAPRCE